MKPEVWLAGIVLAAWTLAFVIGAALTVAPGAAGLVAAACFLVLLAAMAALTVIASPQGQECRRGRKRRPGRRRSRRGAAVAVEGVLWVLVAVVYAVAFWQGATSDLPDIAALEAEQDVERALPAWKGGSPPVEHALALVLNLAVCVALTALSILVERYVKVVS